MFVFECLPTQRNRFLGHAHILLCFVCMKAESW
jgi:hypothetical protein